MILGMSTQTFTLLHVVISLIGICSGFIAIIGMLGSRRPGGWTALFLITTILTSVTGFPIPPFGFDPPRAVGVISLIALAAALFALYRERLAGVWRWIYAICAVFALYLNVFVGVVQAFQKLAFLNRLAPTQSEPPFLVAQLFVIAIFIVFGFMAVRRFLPETIPRTETVGMAR